MTFQKLYKSKENVLRALYRRGFFTINHEPKRLTGYRSCFIIEFRKTKAGWKGKVK